MSLNADLHRITAAAGRRKMSSSHDEFGRMALCRSTPGPRRETYSKRFWKTCTTSDIKALNSPSPAETLCLAYSSITLPLISNCGDGQLHVHTTECKRDQISFTPVRWPIVRLQSKLFMQRSSASISWLVGTVGYCCALGVAIPTQR